MMNIVGMNAGRDGFHSVPNLQKDGDAVERVPTGCKVRLATTGCLGFVLLSLFLAFPLQAQTNEAPHRGGRYLFIVETSSAMRKRKDNTLQTVRYLMTERLTNQWVPGDTVGLWTFDETLHSGDFPLQVWSPGNVQFLPRKMVNFLYNQPLDKEAKMDEVLPPLWRLMRTSERITVFIISSGTTPIAGTPFDYTLNETYKLNGKDLKKKNLPFVTVLRAWHGRIIGGSIAWQPWPIELPSFPPEPEKPKPVKAEAEAAPATTRQPLIVIGDKPQPAPAAETSGEPPAIQQPEVSLLETNVAETVEPPPPVQPEPTAAPVEAQPAAQPQPEPEPTTTQAPAPVEITVQPVTPSPAPEPAVSAAPTGSDEKSAAPPIQVTAAAPSERPATPIALIATASGLVVVGLILVVVLVRRAQSVNCKSLITQSIERGEK